MSFAATNAAWLANVSPAARKLVLLYMANAHNSVTGQLNPSVDAVARACGLTSCQARRHLHALIKDGLLEVIGNQSGGYHKQASRRYRLLIDIQTTIADATPSTEATPRMDAPNHSHGCTQPLAPMHATPSMDASQIVMNSNESELNRNRERTKNATSLPDNFFPDDQGIKCADQHGVTINIELESFRDYHLARGLVRKDWQASWRTWCRNFKKYGRPNESQTQRPAKFDPSGYLRNLHQQNANCNVIDITPSQRALDDDNNGQGIRHL